MRQLVSRLRAADASVSGALAQFAVGGLIATAGLGFVAVAVLRDKGRDDAIRDAQQITVTTGRAVIEPALSDALMRGDPEAIARLDQVVHNRVVVDPVVRVKIWSAEGRILYSDEPRLIGTRYPLGADEDAVLKRGGVKADLSDLSQPENRFEQRGRDLLEVYMPLRTPSGQVVLFEEYQRYASVTASARSTWIAFLPALIGALVILQLVQLPLAGRLARRIRRGQRDRERLLRSAIDSSETERRRIAADLHDGVVQSLVGLSYLLAAAAERADRNGGAEYGEDFRRGAAATRESIAELRTLLVEIYPPSLQSAGLAAALTDLTAPLRRRGIRTKAEVADDLDLPPGVNALLFRVAQEALRNAAIHANAAQVDVEVARHGRHARIVVADDGDGFDTAQSELAPGQGHFGLRLLADLVRDAGGELRVRSAPGAGTRVEAEVELA
jgi:signal transduction histidine kinase